MNHCTSSHLNQNRAHQEHWHIQHKLAQLWHVFCLTYILDRTHCSALAFKIHLTFQSNVNLLRMWLFTTRETQSRTKSIILVVLSLVHTHSVNKRPPNVFLLQQNNVRHEYCLHRCRDMQSYACWKCTIWWWVIYCQHHHGRLRNEQGLQGTDPNFWLDQQRWILFPRLINTHTLNINCLMKSCT
jgi:hypothetical protein